MTVNRGPGVRQIGAIGTTPKEHRLALAGQYAENSPGMPRSGLLVQAATNVVTPTAATGTLTYSVAPVAAVIARTVGGGVYTPTTTGNTSLNTGAAPASGSRWDLIWVKQNDQEKGDADNEAVLGVTQGIAGATPARPSGSVPAGAMVLAEAQIFSGTASTTAAPNTMTQLSAITAARGAPVPVRDSTDQATITVPGLGMQVIRLDLQGPQLKTYNGTDWTTSNTAWLKIPLVAGFTHLNSSGWAGGNYMVKDGWVIATGAVSRASSWTADQVFGVIPAALKPTVKIQGVNCQIEPTVGNIVFEASGPIGPRSFFVTWPLG